MGTRVRLLGSPRLERGERVVPLPKERPLWLLSYLGAQEDWVSREELLELFWPGLEPSPARNNLRQLLHRVRQMEGVEGLEADANGVRWRAEVDVRLFRQALARGQWERALELYGGPLLEGVRVYGLPELENWLEAERQDLQTAWGDALLSQVAQTQPSPSVLERLERLLEHDLFNERAVQAFLHHAAALGQFERARELYAAFARRLEGEMGLEPDPATRRLLEELLRAAPPQAAAYRAQHNLPTRLTTFIGREEELSLVNRRLESGERLITLTGPGGMGKTRLALSVAESQLGAFAEGVWFVALAPLSHSALIVPAVAEALGLSLVGTAEPKTRLLEHLREREMLLVLDNFEHLMEGAELVLELLREAPHLRLLVTSRERLRLQAEWVLDLQGLSYPPGYGLEAVRRSSAVRLFVERANRVWPQFALTPQVAPAVLRICQLVQGMPLGLELAAAWVSAFTPQDIAEELERSLGFLDSPALDLPERHRSLRAVFEHSWRLLAPEQQQALAHLTVFRGGFDRQAALKVAGVGPPALLALADKSLLRRTPSGRFELHEVIRQQAQERAEASGVLQAIRQAHAWHYLALAEEASAHLRGPEEAHWLERLAAEHDNLRTALEWAVSRQDAILALRLATSVHHFWYVRGHHREGRTWLERAFGLPLNDIPPRLHAKALNALAERAKDQGDYAQALQAQQEALDLWQRLEDSAEVAGALHSLGTIVREQGNFDQALAYFEESLRLRRELDDRYGIATTLNDIGVVYGYRGQFEASRPYFEESLARKREIGDRRGIAYALGNLGQVLSELGEGAAARALTEESLAIKRELGDQQGIAVSLVNLAILALQQGDLEQAWDHLEEGLRILYALERRWSIGVVLGSFAELALRRGQFERAVRLVGAVYSLTQAMALSEPPMSPENLERYLAAGRQHLEPETFERALVEGKGMNLEQIVAYALQQSEVGARAESA
ncbi:tetratricopeptide repeat protein [Calidithermus roseus]|uniref:tetratricopeptide repeat protein n=1 Tax=Calidithermus roseus TaxID=1644118 RepID=UPI0015FB796C|nr:tetratricopeptide repeat protein [Calidithermus roseus]